jgi:hypothetical protein
LKLPGTSLTPMIVHVRFIACPLSPNETQDQQPSKFAAKLRIFIGTASFTLA